MSRFWLLVCLTHFLIALVLVVRVLRHRREPVAMTAWILGIVTVPVLGMVAYWLLSPNRLRRKVKRRRRRVAQLTGNVRGWIEPHALRRDEPVEGLLPADLARIELLGRRLADLPATGGNEVRVLEEAETTYAALADTLRAAERHIHLEYYIWQPDETGHVFRDLLVERARDGVECRVLLDAVGCWKLGRDFLRPLREAGVQVAFFMPLLPFWRAKRWSLHLRTHRKIAVVDGRVGFLGSQNIGDEYRGRLKHLSPWYDTHMRVRGPAALFLQQTFAENWYLATREQLDREVYFPRPERPGSSIVQVLPTGPDQSVSSLTQIVFAAVSSASDSIQIATPYFVPDQGLRMALVHAGLRGVPVRLVLPTRSDVPLALWAARSFYPELIDAGVEIREYDTGVLHSKLVTIDNRWCMLGSANMDARSFRLNFEITALIYDGAVATELAQSIDRFCQGARRITQREVHRPPLRRQIGEGVARLFAPLL